jgi:Sodium:solute symporter family
VFAGVPLIWGVLLTGGITLIYSVVGGLWADALTDLSQFVIQLAGGSVMFIAVLVKLGGNSAIWTIWSHLPQGHAQPFNGQYTVVFTLTYFLVNLLSYNGGTWNLAQRFIAAPTGADARRAAILSAVLYLVWPLVLFLPMWAAPILLPDLHQPTQSYALLTQLLLPPGLIGLVFAGIFAHTMAMSSSDANAIAAVVTRDILPVVWRRARHFSESTELLGRPRSYLSVHRAQHQHGAFGRQFRRRHWADSALVRGAGWTDRDPHAAWHAAFVPQRGASGGDHFLGSGHHHVRPGQIRGRCGNCAAELELDHHLHRRWTSAVLRNRLCRDHAFSTLFQHAGRRAARLAGRRFRSTSNTRGRTHGLVPRLSQ